MQAVGHDGLAGTRQKLQIRTFSKLGLYFGGLLLGLASILDGKDHVAHQIEDLLTRQLKKMRPEGSNCEFLMESMPP